MKKKNKQDITVKEKGIDPAKTLMFLYLFIVAVGVLASALDANAKQMKNLPEKIEQGQLYLVKDGEKGKYLQISPLQKEIVKMSISGIINRVVVEQHFINTSDIWVEAVYAFPLPEESAIDHLRLRIGEREIIGVIQKKKEAEKTYEEAKESGRKASLLVQRRPNIFTCKIANIAPGERIVATVEYQQGVRYDNGIFSLRFPMVIFPRYIPGTPLINEKGEAAGVATGQTLSFTGGGWVANTDAVPDASTITPPVDTTGANPIPVELSIDLAAGVPLQQITSLYHGIKKEKRGQGHYQISFTGEVKADQDFVLQWQPQNTLLTQAALFYEQKNGEDYSLLMVMPPHKNNSAKTPPREMIFILDISGSMAGPSLHQAREAIKLALQRLTAKDSFFIIIFNDDAQQLFAQPIAGSKSNINKAISIIDTLQADGGTEMRSALELALTGKKEHEKLRQIIFLTDGAVGNEKELMDFVASNLGDSRLFTVGIGSAPNSWFMHQAATLGRGSHIYIGNINEVQKRMEKLFLKLENPALCNIKITSKNADNAANMEIFPSPLSDLYYGEPLFIAIKGGKGKTLQLAGDFAGDKWHTEINTQNLPSRKGVATLWARKKIRSLQIASSLYGKDQKKIQQEITALGLRHHLITDYTSLVAVDKNRSRPNQEEIHKEIVKSPLPKGVMANMIFAGAARSGTDSHLRIILGIFLVGITILFLRRKIQ